MKPETNRNVSVSLVNEYLDAAIKFLCSQ